MKRHKLFRLTIWVLCGLGLVAFAAGVGYAQVGGSFDLSWNTVDGGGSTFSTGGDYTMGGTTGQFDAGAHTGGQFDLQGGFWGGAVNVPTPTPTGTPTRTHTSTPTTTSTNTPQIPTSTATNTPIIPTNTPTGTPSNTPTIPPTLTATPISTATSTATATSSSTATATNTRTATASTTATATNTPANTSTRTSTATPSSTSTNTPIYTPTATQTGTTTRTVTRTSTATSMAISTGTSTATTTTTTTATTTRTVTQTVTATATATCTLEPNYNVTHTAGNTVIPATNLVPGSICQGCVVSIDLPFPYTLYDQTFTTANVSPKGSVQFGSSVGGGNNVCLPTSTLDYAILPYWDDFSVSPLPVIGVFTDVMGTAPNRVFIVEWRLSNPTGPSSPDWEVLLYEGEPRFDIIYRSAPGRGVSATIGVQESTGVGFRWVQWSCNSASIQSGDRLSFDRGTCP